jgi:hypothetical protein
MAGLGVPRINTVSMDPDLGHSLDEFGLLASDLAAIDPTLIGYVQLSDNTLRQRGTAQGGFGRPDGAGRGGSFRCGRSSPCCPRTS